MLKNFWYPIEFGKDVTSKPMRARVLGQDLVVYRTKSGAAQVDRLVGAEMSAKMREILKSSESRLEAESSLMS